MISNSKPMDEDALAGDPAAAPQRSKRKPSIQDHIGQELRAMYDEVLQQPIPDRFLELLEALDKKADKP